MVLARCLVGSERLCTLRLAKINPLQRLRWLDRGKFVVSSKSLELKSLIMLGIALLETVSHCMGDI